MPAINDFVGHIITISPRKKFPLASQIIPEFGTEVDGNKLATTYIPATSGKFFAAWWWPTGERKGLSYSVEFVRDGESVVHLFFGPKESAYFDGGVAANWEDDDGTVWVFQFRNIACIGSFF